MDSKIALAVMEKARRVFEREDTFLSFPLNPIVFSRTELNAIAEGDLTDAALMDFSQEVNQVPTGIIWPPDEPRYLWNIYHELQAIKLAASTRTPEEEEDYQKALQFLSQTGPNGLREDSQAVKAYNQYRDIWFVSQQEYNSKKSTADLSDDPSEKKQWTEVDEPALRAKIAETERLWKVNGYRAQVEDAQRIVASLGSKSPQQTWAEWMKLYNEGIDLKTTPSGVQFVPTGFAPSNAFDDNAWQKFSLTGVEAAKLINQAPPELQARLAPEQLDIDIDSLSFEYSSVVIRRPWLALDLFKARFWTFYGNTLLSNGRIPPSGLFPAYVAALVFVRNLEIDLKPDSQKNSAAIESLKTKGNLNLGFFLAAPITKEVNARKGMILYDSRIAEAKTANYVPANEIRRSFRKKSSATLAATPEKPVLMRSAILFKANKVDEAKPSAVASHAVASSISRIKLANFIRLEPPMITNVPDTRGDKPSQPPDQSSDDFMIMAFICRRLPKSPDPDQTLQW